MDALKLKFKKLRLMPKPTGRANCPEAVKRAKSAHRAIESSMAVAELAPLGRLTDSRDGGREAREDSLLVAGCPLYLPLLGRGDDAPLQAVGYGKGRVRQQQSRSDE